MNLTATIANSLWSAANLPSYLRFRRALWRPAIAQHHLLQSYLERNRHTAFGQAHALKSVHTCEEFVKRVPIMDYGQLEPWMERVRHGETNVLTSDAVTHLVPTSGSTGARKLIPFTDGLQREFNAAIGPWLVDLLRPSPEIAGGSAYWSITPITAEDQTEDSTVPIGFDADTAYLGGMRQQLASAVMAVPDELRFIKDIEVFRYVTLLCLLRQRELRLISVWHPSFLSLLLNVLPANWHDLLADIWSGQCKHMDALPPIVRVALKLRPLRQRASELRIADPQKPETLWPHLKLISCWSDASAGIAAANLKNLFPKIIVQPKGLLATEAFVTIPFAGFHPVAICSHFFEFIDTAGEVQLLQDLRAEETYEVVVTTAGGLWRYRLRDSVQLTGFIGRTPSLRFLGRGGNVSDLFGEKLSEEFVTRSIEDALAKCDKVPSFVMLAPEEDAVGYRYTIYFEGSPPTNFTEALDRALRQNPHYACCRDLGQLQPIGLFVIAGRGFENYASRQTALGMRLGDIKPTMFSRISGWSNIFDRAKIKEAKDLIRERTHLTSIHSDI